MNSTNFFQMLHSGSHSNRVSVQEKERNLGSTSLRGPSHCWTCLSLFPPLWSFSHFTPPCLCPFLFFPALLLSVSCLESQSAGQPKVHKLVSGGAVEREATCSGGSAAFTPIWAFFSLQNEAVFSGTSSYYDNMHTSHTCVSQMVTSW